MFIRFVEAETCIIDVWTDRPRTPLRYINARVHGLRAAAQRPPLNHFTRRDPHRWSGFILITLHYTGEMQTDYWFVKLSANEIGIREVTIPRRV